jgi:hypothetical protein
MIQELDRLAMLRLDSAMLPQCQKNDLRQRQFGESGSTRSSVSEPEDIYTALCTENGVCERSESCSGDDSSDNTSQEDGSASQVWVEEHQWDSQTAARGDIWTRNDQHNADVSSHCQQFLPWRHEPHHESQLFAHMYYWQAAAAAAAATAAAPCVPFPPGTHQQQTVWREDEENLKARMYASHDRMYGQRQGPSEGYFGGFEQHEAAYQGHFLPSSPFYHSALVSAIPSAGTGVFIPQHHLRKQQQRQPQHGAEHPRQFQGRQRRMRAPIDDSYRTRCEKNEPVDRKNGLDRNVVKGKKEHVARLVEASQAAPSTAWSASNVERSGMESLSPHFVQSTGVDIQLPEEWSYEW